MQIRSLPKEYSPGTIIFENKEKNQIEGKRKLLERIEDVP